VSGRTPAGGEVVEGATPVGHTPGGGEVRRSRGAGSTPGGGEVHPVTTRPARAKKRRPPKADAEADEEPAPGPARTQKARNGVARAANRVPDDGVPGGDGSLPEPAKARREAERGDRARGGDAVLPEVLAEARGE